MNILIFIFCALYFILAFRRLDWAVMLLIAALPSYLIRFQIFGVPFTLLEAMILISFGNWFLKNYRGVLSNIKRKFKNRQSPIANRQSQRYPFDVEIVLLLVISFLAAAVSGFSDISMGIWKAYFFEPTLLFIVILNVFGPKKNKLKELNSLNGISKILWPLAISALAVSLLAIYQKFTGAWIPNELWAAAETRRVTSFFGYPNAVGLYLGPIVLLLIGFLIDQINLTRKKLNKIFDFQILKIAAIILTIILSILSIYFAKSEGALIGVAAGLAAFGLFANKRARLATMIFIVVFLAALIVFPVERSYILRNAALKNLSGEIRKQQWRETAEMLRDGRILLGAGLANYQIEIKPYHQEGIFFNKDDDPDFKRKIFLFNEEYKKEHWQPAEIYLYPHNIFLNFWTELGLAGMLLFVWIIGKYFIMGFKIIRNSEINNNNYFAIGLMGAMLVIVIHGLVDVPYFKNDLAAMFWILAAVMGILNLKNFPKTNGR